MKAKSVLLVLTVLVLLPLAGAVAWDGEDLQGKWVITAIDGEDDGDRSNVWEFRGKQWIAWSGKTALPPDEFTVDGDVIDLGYARIKVLEFSKDRMRTEQLGFVYTLEKQP